VNWKDAAKYYNREVTVEGKVVKTYNSGSVIFLQFSDNPDANKVVIFPQDWNKFPDRPDKFFANKTIRVKGKIQKFQGAPEVIVNNASQITVAGQ
jgi:DNA/RNA endonuclease YhcR with UshA esterase domain